MLCEVILDQRSSISVLVGELKGRHFVFVIRHFVNWGWNGDFRMISYSCLILKDETRVIILVVLTFCLFCVVEVDFSILCRPFGSHFDVEASILPSNDCCKRE